MQLKADLLSIEAGGSLIVVMNRDDAAELGVISSDRVFLKYGNEHAICILNISSEDEPGIIGIYGEVKEKLGIQQDSLVTVEVARRPELEFLLNSSHVDIPSYLTPIFESKEIGKSFVIYNITSA